MASNVIITYKHVQSGGKGTWVQTKLTLDDITMPLLKEVTARPLVQFAVLPSELEQNSLGHSKSDMERYVDALYGDGAFTKQSEELLTRRIRKFRMNKRVRVPDPQKVGDNIYIEARDESKEPLLKLPEKYKYEIPIARQTNKKIRGYTPTYGECINPPYNTDYANTYLNIDPLIRVGKDQCLVVYYPPERVKELVIGMLARTVMAHRRVAEYWKEVKRHTFAPRTYSELRAFDEELRYVHKGLLTDYEAITKVNLSVKKEYLNVRAWKNDALLSRTYQYCNTLPSTSTVVQ